MKPRVPRQDQTPRPRWRNRWLLLALALPPLVFAGLIALAPNAPERVAESNEQGDLVLPGLPADDEPFHYIPDDEVYALDLDPREVRFGLLEGWDREQDAYEDIAALAYVSGPMYERHIDNGGQEITVPLGDLKFGPRVWRGRNRTASRQRAFIGIRHDGSVDFGFGELTDDHSRTYETFIGGLHSLYNDLEEAPDTYKGAYSISMGQRIRYYLPRIRMVMGLRDDGHLEVLMSRDGLTLEQTKELARRRGYLAAYMPDHASKSRFIIPGTKGFTEEDANWISGGATSFVHVPYMLRLSRRQTPLRGNLIAGLTPKLPGDQSCEGAVACVQAMGLHLTDRALAGLNRVMEQGVEPLARMIWAPAPPPERLDGSSDEPPKNVERSPLREPPITADPLVLRERPNLQEIEPVEDGLEDPTLIRGPITPLPPDLPPPMLLEDPVLEMPAETPLEGDDPVMEDRPEMARDPLIGAPPPPELPPLPVVPDLPAPPVDLRDQDARLLLE